MERKVGEIFEYNGEWYQCVEQPKQHDCATVCELCSFNVIGNCDLDKCSGTYRSDSKSVIFKKLEKVGDPYVAYGLTRQKYKLHVPLVITNEILDENISCDEVNVIIDIRAKQNKEDMKEKKLTYEELEHYYDSTCGLWAIDRDPKQVTLEWIVENAFQLGDTIPEKVCASNLKPFDLEAAKAGKPVCTRDGRKARIICFDYKGDSNAYPILALISTINSRGVPSEIIAKYTEDGRYVKYNNVEYNEDLMILPEKKEGWMNIYNHNRPRTSSENCYIMTGVSVFETKEGAISYIDKDKEYIDTVKIEWEE